MKNSPTLGTTFQTLKIILLALVLAAGFQYVVAQAADWRAPTANAPGGNTPAPLNVGRTGQIKDGGITLGQLAAPSDLSLNIPNGRVILKPGGSGGANGYVLKTDGTGLVSWGQDNTGAGGGGGYTCGGVCAANQIPMFKSGAPTALLENSPISYSGLNRVGIYTSAPTQTLDVSGNINGTQLCIAGVCKSAWPSSPTISSSCNWVYGSGTSPQELICPAGQIQTGVKIVDTNSGCNLGNGVNTCGMRTVAIKCCPFQ